MNIKLSSFRSFLHQNEVVNNELNKFLKEVSENVGDELKLAELDDYDCDLKLIFIESGGSEGLFLKNFSKLQAPYYFLTTGSNNSLAASLEILTYLNNNNLKGEIIHGSTQYVAERIKNLCVLEKAKKALSKAKFGVIGHPSDWLISSVPNYEKFKETFGANLVDIPLDEVTNNYLKVDFNDVKFDLKQFDQNELNKAKNVYLSLLRIVKKHNLSGLTLRCFDLISSIHSTGCLGLSLLNNDFITASCEGDIMALVSMYIANIVTGMHTFQANPSKINVEENKIIFAHCTLPIGMVEKYDFDTHFESNTAVALKGYLKEDDVTILRISSNLKDYFLEEGHIIRNLDEKNLCRTQIEVKVDGDVSQILKRPCGNHHIIFYGRHKKIISELLEDLLK